MEEASSAMEPLIGNGNGDDHPRGGGRGVSYSFRQFPELDWVFDELPKATVVSVSRPDTGDISPMLLSYSIELQYKQFKWRLQKKASQVLYLHFALRKRVIVEELHEKQEQVREWLLSLGIGEHVTVVQDVDEPDDGAVPANHEESLRKRYVPSRAALEIICPTLGSQQAISDKAKVAMQNYINHFLGNMDIVNSREVCKFLEVSKYSFSMEYGPKLKEGYVMVKHLSKISRADDRISCCPCQYLFDCFDNNWQKVWAVLKPGFLALLEDPFSTEILDIVIFNVLPTSNGSKGSRTYLADQLKEQNPLRYTFMVSSGSRSIRMRTSSVVKVNGWVSAINDAGLRPLDGWCHSHRYGSFSPQRGLTNDGSRAQWFVDGEAAFDAIASAIENAKSEIFITGWWLCPELYLRRPFESHPGSRLESLLGIKAKQGVQIYILLYKEISIALQINSQYSKKRLQNIHENVRVLRHPDHLSTGVYLWSHHEKLVIIDYRICFIGGLDLCFGRYDTPKHRVADSPPHLWPGKDYYNPRESEPNSWEDAMKDELDRGKYPRMPWHDVHCALWGPPCRDVARHFVQRWNHAKRSKAPNEQAIPLLMPHHHMVLPHYMGRSKDIDIENKSKEDSEEKIDRESSLSSPSPMQDIPLLLPQESDVKFSDCLDQKLTVQNNIDNGRDQPIPISAGFSFPFQNSCATADMQTDEFLDDLDARSELQLSNEWSEASEENNTENSSVDYGQVGPCCACHCQIIRSVSHWSAGTSQPEESIHDAYCSLIEKAEHFIYIENQFFISGLYGDDTIQNRVSDALYKRILQAHKEQKRFRVIIVLPLLPGFQGGLDDGGAATVRALMHWQYRTISREKTSILHHLDASLGPKTNDYISFYGLRTHGRLQEDGPMATSQVYVHSKVMIVDDRIAVIGSSNINDRSLLGSRDSEIGVVIEDKEFVESSMNGEPWKAGKFAHSLRRSLWSEHLNLDSLQSNRITDPITDATYKDLWLATAKENTKIYEDVFGCLPNDQIHSRAALRQHVNLRKEKLGHVTIDLGIAPEKMEESNEDGEAKMIEPMERLESIRGHLVSFPLEFMRQEDLRPMMIEGEFYTSSQVFH